MPLLDEYPNILLALAIWREARSQPLEARQGVKHVILNRVAHPSGPFAQCHDIVSNILQPFQFSSFNAADPNASRLPNPKIAGDWQAWKEICALVDADTNDNTGGANYYFSIDITPPAWADPGKETIQIGAFRFYKL